MTCNLLTCMSDPRIVSLLTDTVGCSGVFCAASNAIEQCKTEGLVDVFQDTQTRSSHYPVEKAH